MKKVYYFFVRLMLCIILFLILAIICKKDIQYKEYIQNKIYYDHLSFSAFKDFYDKYLGGVFAIDKVISNQTNYVFNEKLNYSKVISYEDGALLSVSKNYLVPSLNDGVIVYIGEKSSYNNVVIVENDSGIDIWYGNLCNVSVQLYDHIESGSYLGESCDDFIYLVYTRENEFLDYRDYLN